MAEQIQGNRGAGPLAPCRETRATILVRVVVGLLGSYAVTWFVAAALTTAASGASPQGRGTLGQMIGPLVYAAAVIWAFSVRRLRVAVVGIALAAIVAALLWWILGDAR
ncbi:MAG: hypothetical protein LBC37_02905 [Zoogloeaceae bacterium]|jgi:hypothetical protein|nr:hypothetical protein [Zoogloeaceae bacterium]